MGLALACRRERHLHSASDSLGLQETAGRTAGRSAQVLRRGRALEGATLGWNVVAIVVLSFAALNARSGALLGSGLDSLVEIVARTEVLWELAGTGEDAQRRASLHLIGSAFLSRAAHLSIQTVIVLAQDITHTQHPSHRPDSHHRSRDDRLGRRQRQGGP